MPSAFGYIYVLANPAMPNMVKIGKCRDIPNVRAAKLSRNTAVPAAFEVIFQHRVYDLDAIERLIHRELGYRRYSRKREFYTVNPNLAVSLVRSVILAAAEAERQFVAGLSPLGRKLYELRKARGDSPAYELDKLGGEFYLKDRL
jgi:hypothetical protein